MGEKKRSASEVSNLVFGEFGVEISKSTIQREVAEDRIGMSPKKKGPQGIIPPLIDDTLCNAFESYIQIKQLNGQGTDITNNKLIELLKKCTRSVTELNCNHLGVVVLCSHLTWVSPMKEIALCGKSVMLPR